MLVYTFGELLAVKRSMIPTTPLWEKIKEECYYLYAFQDGASQISYVGRSHNPLLRLREHMQYGDAGYHIRKNRPDSMEWHMWLFSYRNCVPLVHDYLPGRYQSYLEALAYEESSNKGFPPIRTPAMEIAEEALIAHYWPCDNVAGRVHMKNSTDHRGYFTRPLARRDTL